MTSGVPLPLELDAAALVALELPPLLLLDEPQATSPTKLSSAIGAAMNRSLTGHPLSLLGPPEGFPDEPVSVRGEPTTHAVGVRTIVNVFVDFYKEPAFGSTMNNRTPTFGRGAHRTGYRGKRSLTEGEDSDERIGRRHTNPGSDPRGRT
jgi:hypothetical protein